MTRVLGKWVAVALLAVAALGSVQVHSQKVGQAALLNNKHNLSTSGTGTIKATNVAETQTCVFCHVPHAASTAGPLWNRRTPANTYTPYSSTTTNAVVGQPDGSSLLCLSCHDGTIALGELTSRGATIVSMTGVVGVGFMPAGVSNIGIDLSNDHPVSFVYNAALVTANAGELADPTKLTGKVKLHGPTQKLQCSSCHDAHDNSNGRFLVVANTASALCIACHTKNGFSTSDHATKANTYTGASNTYNGTTYATPWTHTSGTTVAANACENCHRPHTAPGAKRLLNYAKEEDNCLGCHNGTAMSSFTAKNNIMGEYANISKTSSHGGGSAGVMTLTGIHDPNTTNEPANVTAKHVECVDCHNPHQAKAQVTPVPAAVGNALTGPLTGVRGVTSAGVATASASREDEVCYRCHGDEASTLFSPGPVGMPRVPRLIVQGNTRLEFATGNPSFHPVAGAGRSAATAMPSLISPWTATSTMKCSHCHSNDAGPNPVGPVAGTGPNGPHASINTPLLVKAYVNTEVGSTATNGGNPAYNAANYALCFMCHSSTSILGNDAGSFTEHSKHIGTGVQAPCSTCHDPHGVSSTQGSTLSNARLINFNSVAVKAAASGVAIRWEKTATGGRCYLSCHGKVHNPITY
jgi:predicted CXXCH cytochrome family protein